LKIIPGIIPAKTLATVGYNHCRLGWNESSDFFSTSLYVSIWKTLLLSASGSSLETVAASGSSLEAVKKTHSYVMLI